jgi:hypothetical protein
MCQPIPASPNNRTDNGVNVKANSSARKIKSVVEGITQRAHGGPATSRGFSAKELLEPSVIA